MISSKYITDYLLEKFSENYKLGSGGVEIIVPSIFVKDDEKCHMSINLETGLWQCFKTSKKGNFIHLYAELEDLAYKAAKDELTFESFYHNDTKIWDWASKEGYTKNVSLAELHENYLEEIVPDLSVMRCSPEAAKAWNFLYNRNLFSDDHRYFVCKEGLFKNRLIIPIYEDNDYKKEMVFFQARALYSDMQPKYLNPIKTKTSHILPPFDYEKEYVVITEGPLDMITLQIAGVNATCTFGSSISSTQIDYLKAYPGKIILGYDNDKAGRQGIERMETMRLLARMPSFSVCFPLLNYKDWNEVSIKLPNFDFSDHISKNQVLYDFKHKVEEALTE
jgi:DNA primase